VFSKLILCSDTIGLSFMAVMNVEFCNGDKKVILFALRLNMSECLSKTSDVMW